MLDYGRMISAPSDFFTGVSLCGPIVILIGLLFALTEENWSVETRRRYCLYALLPLIYGVLAMTLCGLVKPNNRTIPILRAVLVGFLVTEATLIAFCAVRMKLWFPGFLITLAQLYSGAWAGYIAMTQIENEWLGL